MLAGVADPIAFLANADEDWAIAAAVAEKAFLLQDERGTAQTKALVRGIGQEVGNQVARALGRIFS